MEQYFQFRAHFRATWGKSNCRCLCQNIPPTWHHCQWRQGITYTPPPFVQWGSKCDCRLQRTLVWLILGKMSCSQCVLDLNECHRRHPGERSQPPPHWRRSERRLDRRVVRWPGRWLEKSGEAAVLFGSFLLTFVMSVWLVPARHIPGGGFWPPIIKQFD